MRMYTFCVIVIFTFWGTLKAAIIDIFFNNKVANDNV